MAGSMHYRFQAESLNRSQVDLIKIDLDSHRVHCNPDEINGVVWDSIKALSDLQ